MCILKEEIEDSTEFENLDDQIGLAVNLVKAEIGDSTDSENIQISDDEEGIEEEIQEISDEEDFQADNKASSSNAVICSIPITEKNLTKTKKATKTTSKTKTSVESSFSEHKINLKELLESTLEGKALLLHYQTKPFENVHRHRLVRIICTRILESPQKKISTGIYKKWTDEILQLFPQEKEAVYLRARELNKGLQIMRNLAGKLPYGVKNLKKRYKKHGLIV